MKFKSYLFRIAIFSYLLLFISSNTFAAPTFLARYDLSANDAAPNSIIFNDDGTSMYMTGIPVIYMLVPSSLKIIELGAASFALRSYLAKNVGAAKVFELINNNKYENIAILKR